MTNYDIRSSKPMSEKQTDACKKILDHVAKEHPSKRLILFVNDGEVRIVIGAHDE